jgi:hypothetical protein
MSQEGVELIKRGFEEIKRGNLFWAEEMTHPDVVMVQPPEVPDAKTYEGRTAWVEAVAGSAMPLVAGEAAVLAELVAPVDFDLGLAPPAVVAGQLDGAHETLPIFSGTRPRRSVSGQHSSKFSPSPRAAVSRSLSATRTRVLDTLGSA